MRAMVNAAPVRTWGSPDEEIVVVDDVKALRQAVHEEMEAIGCGAFQRRTVTILGFGNVADAVEILAIGYILTVYEDSEGPISPWESSLLTAAVFAGMLAGGLLGGVLGDVYGRKPVLLVTLAINAASAFLSACSTSIYWLIFFRTLAGVGVGGVVSSLSALCLEHVPVSVRGRYITILCSFWMVGSVMTAATAWIMLGKSSGGDRILDISWRWFAAVVGIPSFTCCILSYWYIPESAHFLASRGDAQGASEVLQYIHKVHRTGRHIRLEFAAASSDTEVDSVMDGSSDRSINGSPSESSPRPLRRQPSASSGRGSLAQTLCSRDRMRTISRLFQHPQLPSTLVLMLCGYCLSFGSYGLSTWITKLFQSVGLSNPFANAFLFAAANLPGNIVSLYLIDVIGHRKLFSCALFASSASALLFAFNTEGSATAIVLLSCLFNACVTAGWNGFGVLSAENFPLELRTTGISIANCSNRVGAITAQFVNGFLIGPPPHVEALLLVVSSVVAVGGISSRYLRDGSANEDGLGSPPPSEHDTKRLLKARKYSKEDEEMKQLEEADLQRDLQKEEENDDRESVQAGTEVKACLRRGDRSDE